MLICQFLAETESPALVITILVAVGTQFQDLKKNLIDFKIYGELYL